MRGRDDGSEAIEFPALLKRLRTEAGISQQALAGRALVSVQAISALERGYRKAPYRETLDRLAEALALQGDVRTAFEAAAARARGMRAAEASAPVHNLPRQLTSFLGREEVVKEIAGLVESAPLVTLTGTGGAGKTRTAIEVGARSLEDFAEGVWFVELAALSDPALVTHAVAAAIGVQESTQRPLMDSLIAFMEQKRSLLILDNCEHLVTESRRVAGLLLSACPRLSIIATSREALKIAGERVYQIPPLAFPLGENITPREALSYGAVALFADRALAADGRFIVSDENVAAVVGICRRLDGLPLAIELAAARVPVLSPRQLVSRLDKVFSVLTSGSHSVLPRHQTMRAVIDWSYGLLSSQARLLFNRLAVFTGTFTLEAASEICADARIEPDDVLDVLSSLVARSLVSVSFAHVDARYYLLEATRQYANEKLVEQGDFEAFEQRHAQFYLRLAQRLDREWYSVPERGWLEEAELEFDNFRTALDRTLAHGLDVPTGQLLAGELERLWYLMSPIEGQRWVSAALDAGDEGTTSYTLARLYVADAELHGALGQYKSSLAAAERAMRLLQSDGEPLQLARAKQSAGSALGALGRGAEGELLLREALATARQLGNHRLSALSLGYLGTARARRGDAAGARGFYAEALAMYSSHGFDRPAASIAGRLAEVEFAAGDAAAALRRAAEARAGHEATRNRRSVAIDLSNMAAYLVALGYYDDARRHALEALAVAREMKATVLTAFILQHVAAALALQPQSDAANARRRLTRAGRVAGFVEQRLSTLGARREYTEQQEYNRLFAALHEEFTEDELEEFMGQGRDWTEDRAVSEVLKED